MLNSFFGPSGDAAPAENASLLSDWRSYAASSARAPGDDAAAAESGSYATQLASRMQSGLAKAAAALPGDSTSVAAAAKAAAGSVSAGLSSGASALRDAAGSASSSLQMLSTERLLLFACLTFFGVALVALAFFVGLPLVVLSPAKFALPFTLGSACNMAALGALRGPYAQLSHMAAPERAPLSALYLFSMAATLWAALIAHSYILCLLASVLQLGALLVYQVSYFPGGVAGLKLVTMSAGRVLRPAAQAAYAAVVACFSGGSSLSSLLPL